jgi:hypothetical protein
MRLAGVTILRDECDVVEAFVRHNAALLNRLYIVDNCSSDATPEILRRLAAEGLPLVPGEDAWCTRRAFPRSMRATDS